MTTNSHNTGIKMIPARNARQANDAVIQEIDGARGFAILDGTWR